MKKGYGSVKYLLLEFVHGKKVNVLNQKVGSFSFHNTQMPGFSVYLPSDGQIHSEQNNTCNRFIKDIFIK